MSLFGKLVKTVINVSTLPISVAADVVTVGGVATGRSKTYTEELLQKIKDEA